MPSSSAMVKVGIHTVTTEQTDGQTARTERCFSWNLTF